MAGHKLLQLAQDLEWLGCELEYIGHRHALEGFPESGETWAAFLEKQGGVLATADKLERELKGAVRFNPTQLLGVDFPLEATLETITALLGAVEDIKHSAQIAVHELPNRVRNFTRMISNYLDAVGATRR